MFAKRILSQSAIEEDRVFQEVKKLLGLTEIFAWTTEHHEKYCSFSHAGLSIEQIAKKMEGA